jgi:hypothetical protein
MEMVSKQFSSFMELLVQPGLTDCVTMSYGLWKWLASSSPRLWKWLCNLVLRLVNYVLQFVQLRLTVYGNGWQVVLPIYGNSFRSGMSENQRLYKKLGNSENKVYKFR